MMLKSEILSWCFFFLLLFKRNKIIIPSKGRERKKERELVCAEGIMKYKKKFLFFEENLSRYVYSINYVSN